MRWTGWLLLLLTLMLSGQSRAYEQAIPDVYTADRVLDTFLARYVEDKHAAKPMLNKVESFLKTNPTGPGSAALKVRFLGYQMMYFEHDDEQKFVDVLDRMMSIAKNSGDPDALAEAMLSNLQHYYYAGKNQQAVAYLQDLLGVVERVESRRVKYVAWHSIADFKSWQNKPEAALLAYYKALDNLPLSKMPETEEEKAVLSLNLMRKMNVSASISALHSSLRNYPKALEVLQKSLAEAESYGVSEEYASAIYMQMGIVYVDLENYSAAEKSYKKGLSLAVGSGDVTSEALFHNNLGDLFMRQGRLDDALTHFNSSFALADEQPDKTLKPLLMFNIGQIMTMQGVFGDGIGVMEESVAVMRDITGKSDFLGYVEEMADAYNLAGQSEKEATTLREYITLSKELFQTERDRQINQLQEEFSVKEKEKEIETLVQSNRIAEMALEQKELQHEVMILFVLVVLMTAVLLLIFYNKVRKTNQKLEEANSKLEYQSLRDPLTGLLNRRSLQEYMQQKLADRRATDTPINDGFVLLDIDYFKHINDSYGHAAGDAVLVELAKRLSGLVREDDMVLRWGGEEFLLVLKRITTQDLIAFTRKVLAAISALPVSYNDMNIPVTASAGVINYPFDKENGVNMDWQQTLQLADNALYLSKVHGRNRAYVIRKLNKPYNEIVKVIESDFSNAVEQKIVHVELVEGI